MARLWDAGIEGKVTLLRQAEAGSYVVNSNWRWYLLSLTAVREEGRGGDGAKLKRGSDLSAAPPPTPTLTPARGERELAPG
jgi:hypothetical protein